MKGSGDIRIEDLLPHRNEMLLVDEILDVDDEMALTSARVSSKWPLYDGREVDALVLFELAAQTAGITNGWVRIQRHGRESEKKGWLVGIKYGNLLVGSLALDQHIITRARNQFEFESYREVLATARIGSVKVAEVMLQLIQTEDAG